MAFWGAKVSLNLYQKFMKNLRLTLFWPSRNVDALISLSWPQVQFDNSI